MKWLSRVFLPLVLFVAAAWLRAGEDTAALEPPVVDRPANYSHLIGRFVLQVTADRTTVAVEDPILLRVQIRQLSGPESDQNQPRRTTLHLFPTDLEKDFYKEDLPQRDRRPAERTWELHYRLRPKRVDVQRIPPLVLAYYNPHFRRYQSSYSRPVPLKVTPRPLAELPAEVVKEIKAPRWMYDITTGSDVLRRGTAGGPGWLWLLCMLLGPPLLALLWYQGWRWCYPDARTRQQRQRSRAARQTLRQLTRRAADLHGQQITALMTAYLRRRFDLPAAEPTPAETVQHLRRVGLSAVQAEKAAAFLQRCHEQRFAPISSAPGEFRMEAIKLIQLLEEPC